jgi:hypothetical protein
MAIFPKRTIVFFHYTPNSTPFFIFFKLLPYTLTGFDLTTHDYAGDNTRFLVPSMVELRSTNITTWLG